MGIGRQAARTLLTTIKAGAGNRVALRNQVAEALELLHEWLGRFDAQANQAPALFAADRQGQFNTFVAALPDVEPDTTP
jgi:hypothetical protein